MAVKATVGFCQNKFVAQLSDGRRVERPNFRGMAQALVSAGVRTEAVEFEWKTGQRMITAGQQVALRAEMHRLEQESPAQSIAPLLSVPASNTAMAEDDSLAKVKVVRFRQR